MAVEFRITRGAREGAVERFEKSVVTIGRHPMNDLRFDPQHDLDVSSRHAELRSVGNRHVIHDLGSTNGTYVNGERIIVEAQLATGDVVGFGAQGPQAVFTVVAVTAAADSSPGATSQPWIPAAKDPSRPRTPPGQPVQPAAPPLQVASTLPPPPPAPPPSDARGPTRGPTHGPARAPAAAHDDLMATRLHDAPARPRKNTEVRIAEAVQRQTGTLRKLVYALGGLVVIGGAGALWVIQRTAAASQEQIGRLLAMNDSLSRKLEVRLEQTGMADSALKAARAESQRLAAALRAQQQSGGDVSALAAEIRDNQARTATIARMDYAAVTESNRAAVVFIAVEMPDGKASSGTGFNVLPSGLVVTNRHVVQRPDGTRATRVAVAFDGTQGAWLSATIEYVSAEDELALLRLVRPGPWPVVNGIARDASTLRLGDPVAILGYPLGNSTAGMGGDIDRLRPVATLGVGTVSKTLEETLQLDTYAAQGSSGSPIFDGRGLVVGVLYGAARESGGRIVYAVPAARLVRQLPSDAAGIVR